MATVKPIPDGYPQVTPYLCVDGAEAAIDFYGNVFGTKERMRMGAPDGKAIAALREGVVIDGRRTAPARVLLGGTISKGRQVTTRLIITLTEGRNRQVRRMTAAVGLPTLRLVRWSIGEWSLDGLAPGQWREVSVPPNVRTGA